MRKVSIALALALTLSCCNAQAQVVYSPAAQERLAANEQPPAVVVTVPAPKKQGRVERFCARCSKWSEEHPKTWAGVRFCAKASLWFVEICAGMAQASRRAIF